MSKPILPWPGSKRRLAKDLLKLLPAHSTYVEPFAGAAALLFAKPESDVEVLNDINNDLVTLYRVLQHHLEEFCRQFRWALSSRKLFDWAKLANPVTLTDIQRASRFYFLQRQAFGGKVDGQTFGYAVTTPPRFNLLRLEEDLSAAHLRLARVLIEHLPWRDVMTRYDRAQTLFFCDPPYWETEGYGCEFGFEQYEQLAETMASMKGQAILTINDHPAMRKVFRGFRSVTLETTYTMSGGHKAKPARELVFMTARR